MQPQLPSGIEQLYAFLVVRPEPPGQHTAAVVGLPEIHATAPTREEAIDQVRDWLASGQLVPVEVPQNNPWVKYAGWATEDPDYGVYLEELARLARKTWKEPCGKMTQHAPIPPRHRPPDLVRPGASAAYPTVGDAPQEHDRCPCRDGRGVLAWRLGALSRSLDGPTRIRRYAELVGTVQLFCQLPLVHFDHASENHFQQLRALRLRIGTQDLKIAAVARASNLTLLTRNRRDFARIPGLVLDDWSR